MDRSKVLYRIESIGDQKQLTDHLSGINDEDAVVINAQSLSPRGTSMQLFISIGPINPPFSSSEDKPNHFELWSVVQFHLQHK